MSLLMNCEACGAEIAKSAIACPKCGARIKQPIYKAWWFWFIIIFISINMFGIANLSKDKDVFSGVKAAKENIEESSEENTNLINNKFELKDGNLDIERDNFAVYVKGLLINTTNKTYSYAQVTFAICDEDGAQLGTAVANINNWEAGGTWKFKAIGFDTYDEAAKVKLIGIEAF